jgi:hypothetical protein
MKKYILLIISILFVSETLYAQYDFRAGMGISLVNTPSLINYLNENFAPSNQQLSVFNSSIVFSGEAGYFVNDSYEISLDFSYMYNSYNFSYNPGLYKLSYGFIMPRLLNYYVISGKGYDLKFGGGVGPSFTSVNQQLPAEPVFTYSSVGFGLIVKAEGNTQLSENFYANIGVDLRYDFNGEPKNGSSYLVNPVNNGNVNFNSLSAGIHLGVSYIF